MSDEFGTTPPTDSVHAATRMTAYATLVIGAVQFLAAFGSLIDGLVTLIWFRQAMWYRFFPLGYNLFLAVSLGAVAGFLVRASWQYLGGRAAASAMIIKMQIAWILLTGIGWIHGAMYDWQLTYAARSRHGFLAGIGILSVTVMSNLSDSLPMIIYALLTVCIFRKASALGHIQPGPGGRR